MEIKNAEKKEYYFVETDGEEECYFRRDVDGNSNDWEISMGESWEQTYGDIELEEAFQKWLSENCSTPAIEKQREQFVTFLKWVGDGYDFEKHAEEIVNEYIDAVQKL